MSMKMNSLPQNPIVARDDLRLKNAFFFKYIMAFLSLLKLCLQPLSRNFSVLLFIMLGLAAICFSYSNSVIGFPCFNQFLNIYTLF